MSLYSRFAGLYDASVERLYADARRASARALDLQPGLSVLEVPCGTGTSLDGLVAGVGPTGRVVAVDFAPAMVAQAGKRVAAAGWANVELRTGDVHTIALEPTDRIQTFLGLSVFPRWELAFERLWAHLRPGGRLVIVDVYAERLGLQGRLVNRVAGSDIGRRTWEPLAAVAPDFERTVLPRRWEHGGELYLASGTRPR